MEEFTNVTVAPASCPETENFIYFAFNCYPITLGFLLVNVILLIVGASIIILNIVVMRAVLQRGQMDGVSDIAITSLASTDMLTGMLLWYQTVVNLVNLEIFYECLLRYGLTFGSLLTSAFHLLFLTVERYIKITRPYAYLNIFKRQRVVIIHVFMWISAFSLSFSPLMGWNYRSGKDCGFHYVLDRDFVLVVVLAFLVPLFVNYVLYAHIFKIAHRHAKEIVSQTMTTTLNPRPSNQTWKFTRTVFMLLGFYTICWLPVGIFMLLDYFGNVNHLSLEARAETITFLSVPLYLCSLGNPVIYALKITYVRRHCVEVFGKIPCCCCIKRA